MALDHHVFLLVLQRQPGGDAQLFLHDVDAGNQLGYGVFHLHAGVHFDEEKLAVFIQKFKRAGAAVADAFAGGHAGFADFLALFGGDAGCGCFFDYFLVAALHGAVALAQINGVAVLVGQHLHFHVARALQEAFHIHHRIAEGGFGFGLGHFHGLNQVFAFFHHAHTAPAAAAGSFDDHGIAHAIGGLQDFVGVVGKRAVRTGHTGHAGFEHGFFGRHFVAHQADGFGTRADEDEAGFFHLLGKAVVFSQEAVAGVDGIGAGYFGGGNDGGNVQIALRRGGGADADGFVGQLNVQAVVVGSGMHGHGGDAHFAAGAQYAQGDFATVGDEDFFQHNLCLMVSR